MPDDAWLERLLRDDAALQPHIDDAGFTQRVMAGLPPRSKPVAAWLVPAMTALGCIVTALFTPAVGVLLRGLPRLFDYHHFQAANLMVLAPVALLYFCCFFTAKEP